MKQRGWLIGSLGFGTVFAGVMAGAFATGIEQHTTSVEVGGCVGCLAIE